MKTYINSFIGKRPSNEDEYSVLVNINGNDKKKHNINLFCVFDGHGGNTVSKFLKKIVPTVFGDINNKIDFILNKNINTKKINKVFDNIKSLLDKKYGTQAIHCGSTACIAIEFYNIKNQHKMVVFNVGDSRLVKCNNYYIAEQLTNDHKPNQIHEKRRITGLGGKIEYDGFDWRIKNLSLSRAFGDNDTIPYITHIPDIYSYNINKDDKFIILACDGVWDVLSNQEAVDYILGLMLEYPDKSKCNYAEELTKYTYSKKSTDNITIIIHMF